MLSPFQEDERRVFAVHSSRFFSRDGFLGIKKCPFFPGFDQNQEMWMYPETCFRLELGSIPRKSGLRRLFSMLSTMVRSFETHTQHIHIYTCATRAHARNLRIREVLTLELIPWVSKSYSTCSTRWRDCFLSTHHTYTSTRVQHVRIRVIYEFAKC